MEDGAVSGDGGDNGGGGGGSFHPMSRNLETQVDGRWVTL